jgi:hypothetical protein
LGFKAKLLNKNLFVWNIFKAKFEENLNSKIAPKIMLIYSGIFKIANTQECTTFLALTSKLGF